MPAFIKDELKKKDEQILSDMEKEINEFEDGEGAEPPPNSSDEEEPTWDPSKSEESEEPQTESEESEEDKLKKEVLSLKDSLKESESSLKRLRADFENFRRRTTKEKEEISAVVLQSLLKDMLPLLDNFERALAAESKDLESFRQGVEMIYNQFTEALKKEGLEVIKTDGEKFDPNFHQAVMRVQNEELEDETIVSVLQKGYMAKGRVLRPSMVQVVAND